MSKTEKNPFFRKVLTFTHPPGERTHSCVSRAALSMVRASRAHGMTSLLTRRQLCSQSALLNFQSFLVVVLLFICTATYCRAQRPSFFREKKPGCAYPFARAATTALMPWTVTVCASQTARPRIQSIGDRYHAAPENMRAHGSTSLLLPCSDALCRFRRYALESIRLAQLLSDGDHHALLLMASALGPHLPP